MDDLDREIEEAACAARRGVRQRRLATIASTATFFVVGILGGTMMFTLFPEPGQSDFDTQRRMTKAQNEEPSLEAAANDYSAYRRDQSRTKWKIMPVFALAFFSAYFVSKRLKPAEQR